MWPYLGNVRFDGLGFPNINLNKVKFLHIIDDK